MNKIKNVMYGTMATAMALAPALASAQINVGNGTTGTNLSNKSIGTLLGVILNYLLGFVGILAILGFVVSGIFYLTAAGDEDQVAKAKSIMMYSIIGVIVAVIGFIVVTALKGIFVDTTATF